MRPSAQSVQKGLSTRAEGAPSRARPRSFVVTVGQPVQSPSGWLVVQPVLLLNVFPVPLPS